MSQLIHLRKKIRSVETTKKITHAVRLVSMAQYNKTEKMNAPWAVYAHSIKEMFVSLLSQSKNNINMARFSFLQEGKDDSKPLYVLIATSKGLCGSLNSQLFSFFNEQINTQEQIDKSHFITIGLRAAAFLKQKKASNIVHSYPQLSVSDAFALADELLSRILSPDSLYTSVTFFSSEAKSFFIQKPRKTNIIPLQLDQAKDEKKNLLDEKKLISTQAFFDKHDDFVWEQNKEDVLYSLCCQYLKNSIVSILLQSLRAEYAARFLAMENSTNNAEKLLERLSLQFNKLRQMLITREVSELSAGLLKR